MTEFIVEVTESLPIEVTVEEPGPIEITVEEPDGLITVVEESSGEIVVVETILAPDAVEVIQEGPPGPPGNAGPPAVGHVQPLPDTTWTIEHNLGYYPLSVQAWNEDGDRIVGGVEDVSEDVILIHHTTPQSGMARLA